MASKKATVITYTPKELEVIEVLKAANWQHLSSNELGVPNVILTSLVSKSLDERPMADGVERAMVRKEDFVGKCATCGADISHKLYWLE